MGKHETELNFYQIKLKFKQELRILIFHNFRMPADS